MPIDPFAHLYTQVREFLVLNGSSDSIILRYDAEECTIPPADKVILPDPKNPRVPYSGKNSLGEFIPGTIVVKDIIAARGCPDDITGSARGHFWDAGLCIAHCLGLDPTTHETKSRMAAKGIMLLPMNPTPELVAKSKAACNERWLRFRSEWAKETINFYQTKANQHRANGSHPGMPDSDYYVALGIAKEEEARFEKELGSLGISTASTDDDADDAEMLAAAKAKAAKIIAKDMADNNEVDKDKLADMLAQDPAFMKAFRSKYKVQKHKGSVAPLAK